MSNMCNITLYTCLKSKFTKTFGINKKSPIICYLAISEGGLCSFLLDKGLVLYADDKRTSV